ncbi:MAG: transposase, partial [Opitutales bacterium]|nr:transposase [Opitutales bacterium]
FPNARIVSDRFHVVRVVQHHFMELFKQICPQIERDRGMLAALRKKPENLTEHQRERLDQLLRKYPALKAIYEQQLKVLKLMRVKGANHRNVRRLSKRFIELLRELKQSAFQSMLSLANTLERWAEPIACMWRFNKNNGITEGFHRKMKLIQRRAYGFRNFNNYRLRVIASCG